MATGAASCPVNWRLFVPESWDDTRAETNEEAAAVGARRAKARIPENVRHRPKRELAMEMIDELALWGRNCPVAGRRRRLHALPGRTDRPLDPV